MAKYYKVASEEGAVFASGRLGYPVETGETAELELDHKHQELALLAAGWLEETKKEKK